MGHSNKQNSLSTSSRDSTSHLLAQAAQGPGSKGGCEKEGLDGMLKFFGNLGIQSQPETNGCSNTVNPLYYSKWLFGETSICFWLFGFPGRDRQSTLPTGIRRIPRATCQQELPDPSDA